MTQAPLSPVHFWSWQLLLAMLMNGFVSWIMIGAYAARLAGAKTGRVATAFSLFNVFETVTRMASLIYSPVLGSLSDQAAAYTLATAASRASALANFQWQLRAIVFVGTLGATVAGILLPTFLTLFVRGISSFERSRSLPKTLARLATPRTWAILLRSLRVPAPSMVFRFSLRNMPRDVLAVNIIVTAIYTIGVVSAAYASVLNPGAARTALLSSGLINGIGTICYTLIVDPASAIMTDEAAKGERPIEDVRALVFYLSLTTIIGMLLSQLVLIPAAIVIAKASYLVAGH